MSSIEEVLKTAHISIITATLKVVVDDIKDYEILFHPRCTQVNDDVFEEAPEWKQEMGFPEFVLDVSPFYEDGTLSVWVENPFDLQQLSDWLESFSKLNKKPLP